jgi:aquaporin Z
MTMVRSFRRHWPEYAMEAGELATFLVLAALFVIVIDHPASPVRQAVPDPLVRRFLTGVLMGCTAIALVHSPWGQRSGGHMNPSFTLAYLRLGKIAPWDAAFYIAAHFAGAVTGILIAAALIGPALASPEVRYVATLPGAPGPGVAFAAELTISFLLMLTVLGVSNTARFSRCTPWAVGVLITAYITIEAPLSGMSMNPARTLGPAVVGDVWDALWVYFTAPPLGMLLAAELYVRVRGAGAVWCAKFHHHNDTRCIFRCGHPEPAATGRMS